MQTFPQTGTRPPLPLAPTTTDIDMFIVQSGTSLASTLVLLNGTPCAGQGTLTGTVDQQAVDLTIRESDGPDTITVPGSTDGLTINGSYSISGSCDGGDTGTFFADFIPSIESSRWSGGTSSINGTLSFTADLREDSRGNLSGTMSFSGSPSVIICPSPGARPRSKLCAPSFSKSVPVSARLPAASAFTWPFQALFRNAALAFNPG